MQFEYDAEKKNAKEAKIFAKALKLGKNYNQLAEMLKDDTSLSDTSDEEDVESPTISRLSKPKSVNPSMQQSAAVTSTSKKFASLQSSPQNSTIKLGEGARIQS